MQRDGRVQVPGERSHIDPLRDVAEGHAVDPVGLRFAADIEFGRRPSGGVVVVAFHEDQIERRMPPSPRVERGARRGRIRLASMEQIAEYDDRRRPREIDQRVEAGQVVAGRAPRHRHAAGPKGGCLAEVRVGDHQPTALAPVQLRAVPVGRVQRGATATRWPEARASDDYNAVTV